MVLAGEARSGEDVLGDALPEKAIPQLQAALAQAMSQSPRVIASLLDLDQARVGEMQARSPMLPRADLSGSFGLAKNRYVYDSYQAKDEYGMPLFDTNGDPKITSQKPSSSVVQDLSYSGGINQPIFHWGALKKGYQSAQLQRAIASRNVEEIRRTLAIEIRRAYFSLIGAANGLEFERIALANLEHEKIYLKQQAADGFITQGTADYTDVRIKDFKLQMQRSKNSFDSQWLAFCELTGIDRATPIPVFPKEIPAISQDLLPALQGLAQSDGYVPASLANADDSIRVERLNYEIANTRLLPRFGLSLNASRAYYAPDTVAGFGAPYVRTSYGVGTSVNWAIFDGFSTQAAKQSSLIRLRQQQRARDQAERDYRENLKNLQTNLQLNWQSLQRTEEGLRSSRSSADVTKKDFETGMVPKQAWDAAKAAVDGAQQSANAVRADFYLQIVNYLSLRGKDPAIVLAPKH